MAADARRHLHVNDRQPPVRLDAVRQPDRGQAPLGPARHPGGIHDLHRRGDVARAAGGLRGRPLRAEARGRGLGRARRRGVGHQRLRRYARHAVRRRDRRRHRRGWRVRSVRRKRAQVVPRPTRTRRRHHRDGIRRRLGADRVSHRQHDSVAGLRSGLPEIRRGAGSRRLPCGMAAQGAGRVGEACCRSTQGSRRASTRIYAHADVALGAVLGVVRDVRADGDEQTDRYRAAQTGRKKLRIRERSGDTPGFDRDGAAVHAGGEPRPQRGEPAVLRLDLRSHRA